MDVVVAFLKTQTMEKLETKPRMATKDMIMNKTTSIQLMARSQVGRSDINPDSRIKIALMLPLVFVWHMVFVYQNLEALAKKGKTVDNTW